MLEPHRNAPGPRFRRRWTGCALALACAFALASTLACGGEDAAVAPPASEPAARATPPRSPNLVLITLDTTRADALGLYGQPRPTSPHIDAMASAGTVFDQAVTSSPETLPSHSTIFTGLQPYAHGVRENAGYVLADSNLTLAEHLARHGYRTGAEVAALVLRQETKVAQGFDHYRGVEDSDVELKMIRFEDEATGEQTTQIRVGSDITRRGLEFIRDNQKRKFFLWLHYFDAHNPYSAPAEFNARIPDSPYHAEVASADAEVGRVLEEIERLGLRDETLVVLTADHGEGLGDHGEPSHSYFVWDTTVRVPLVLWGTPSVPKGKRILSLVRTLDIAPTALDLLGLPPLPKAEGVSLGPLLRDEQQDLGVVGYGEAVRVLPVFGLPPLRYVREGRWKYIHKVKPELYDVIADPGELKNRIGEEPEIAERLRARLAEMMRTAPKHSSESRAQITQQTAAELVALGYAAADETWPDLEDEFSSLDLYGTDPHEMAIDISALSVGQGHIRHKEYVTALRYLEKLRKRNPRSAYIQRLYAETLVNLDRRAEAVAVYRLILELEPGNSTRSRDLALSLLELGRTGEALEALKQALVHDPCNEAVLIQINSLFVDPKQSASVLAAIADGASRCPEVENNVNNYAWALATLPDDALRDGARAVSVARSLTERNTTPNPGYLDTLAAALAETGDFDQAVEVQTRAVELLRSMKVPPEVLQQLEAHLESFEAGQPIRDRPGAA